MTEHATHEAPERPGPPLISARPRLRIDDRSRPALNEAALEAHVHLPLSGMASAELRLLNWTHETDGPGARFAFGDLALGQRLTILLGEAAERPAFEGEITALEERYGDGAPQLVLLAEDRLHRLARQRHSRVFAAMSLDEVLRQVAREGGLEAEVQVSEANADWHQLNESDLAFVLRLLRPYDIAVRLEDGRLRARREEADPLPDALSVADNIRRLRLIADLNHQPTTTWVGGYDLARDAAASASADRLQPPPTGTGAGQWLQTLGWAGEEVLPHPFARSSTQAEAWARAGLRQRAKQLVHGEILCEGLPHMHAGREVTLNGVSPRLLGSYQVVDCHHHFTRNGGFTTRLYVHRPDSPKGGSA